MLVENDYLKYDMTLEEYYLTTNAVTNYTEYESDDLGQIFNDIPKALKIISHSIYRLIDSMRKTTRKYEHKQYMRKLIYDNEYGEVNALMFAMLEAVKGAVESGMDLNAYLNEPKDTFPYTVKQELMSAQLLDASDKRDTDLDIEYTTEETEAWS